MKVNSTSPIITIEKKNNLKTQSHENREITTNTCAFENSLKIDVKRSGIPAISLNQISSQKREPEKTLEEKNLDTTSKVITGASTVGGIATIPGEILNNASNVKKLCNSTIAGSVINATISTPNSVKEKAFITVAKTAGKTIRVTDALTTIAVRYNHLPTYNVLSKKVLPTANAVVSGIAIYTNVKKFDKSMKTGNKVEMLKSGTQIVLNTVSGVGGFIQGKGQIISGVAGVTSIFTDFAIDKTVKILNKK